MSTMIKWVSVVYTPTFTRQHLEMPFEPCGTTPVDLDTLWMGYAEYVMEVYGEYHLTERLRDVDEEFFDELCNLRLYGVIEPELLCDVFERITREHQPHILSVMETIANAQGYLKSIQGQWHHNTPSKGLPMLFFECSTLFDLIDTAPTYMPLLE